MIIHIGAFEQERPVLCGIDKRIPFIKLLCSIFTSMDHRRMAADRIKYNVNSLKSSEIINAVSGNNFTAIIGGSHDLAIRPCALYD